MNLKNIYQKNFWSNEKYAKKQGVDIDENCKIYIRNFGSEPYLIKIGNHVQITRDVRFFTHGSAWVLRNVYPDMDFFGKICVKNNVYIGSCSLIMPGVTIGNNVIIAAGSVITKSVNDNMIVDGNPAKVIGKLDDFENKIIPFNLKTKGMNYYKKKKMLLKQEKSLFIKK